MNDRPYPRARRLSPRPTSGQRVPMPTALLMTRRSFLFGAAAALAAPALARAAVLLDPRQFEVIGDGQSNDLPGLRKMLSTIESSGGGTITLPKGRFLLVPDTKGAALTLPANTHIEGSGVDDTILVMAPGSGTHVINAPYGWVQIKNLCVDGNMRNRPGGVGHNIRLEGDQVVVENVKIINAASYGMGIGERRFARGITVRNVTIQVTRRDGIDIKNRLNQTTNVVIENVSVSQFGLPEPNLSPDKYGTKDDAGRGEAGVDLRGLCEVRGLTITGILPGRVGLRFRWGEVGGLNGPGAHRSAATNVVMRGTAGVPQGIGIAVIARDVRLDAIDIQGVRVGAFLTAERTRVGTMRARASQSQDLLVQPTRFSHPNDISLQDCAFDVPKLEFKDVEHFVFDHCSFARCHRPLQRTLSQNPQISLVDCSFDAACE